MHTVTHEVKILPVKAWQARAETHRSRIQPWVDAYRERRKRGQKHPVHDFLFDYYQCKRRLLTDWHPDPVTILEGEAAREFLKDANYSHCEEGVYLNPQAITSNQISRLKWISRLIESALNRRNHFNCYGLHEWAMVYKSNGIRHQDTPLRLPECEIEQVIESQSIRCSHYDAFRFFTEQAKPLNTLQPQLETRPLNEQFGCVHFNMDLLKWCYKLSPWISSKLTADCFFLAVEARELDMRASPYDLSSFGYEPIPIETPEGRLAYQSAQGRIAEQGRALATRYLEECGRIKSLSPLP